MYLQVVVDECGCFEKEVNSFSLPTGRQGLRLRRTREEKYKPQRHKDSVIHGVSLCSFVSSVSPWFKKRFETFGLLTRRIREEKC